jgi:hypothetical protein
VLAERLAGADGDAKQKASFDRTLSCTLTDLEVTFAGRIHDGTLTDIRQVSGGRAQVRRRMSSDDLLRLVDGELNLAAAWASGRVKIDASVFDLLKLRSLF